MLNAPLQAFLRAHARCAFALLAAIVEQTQHCRNPYAIGLSERADKYRARKFAIAPCTFSCAAPALVETQDMVSLRAYWCVIVQKHWFFYRAVVIPMQCARSPRALDDIATHSG
jgi:hypothetical protein